MRLISPTRGDDLSFFLTMLALLAGVPLIVSPFLAYGFYRDGNTSASIKAGAVFAACLLIIVAVPKNSEWPSRYEDCVRFSQFADDC